jgi:hypothetical protein
MKVINRKVWEELTVCERECFTGCYYNSSTGVSSYYENGKLHCENGPAVFWPDGYREYWLNDEPFPEEEFYKRISTKPESSSKPDSTLEITQIVINGKKYNLIPAD